MDTKLGQGGFVVMVESSTVIVGGGHTRQTDGWTERGTECAVTKLC